MVFVSICTALYNYVPQGDNELALQEGDLVYVLEKSTEDDWWKAKKRARPDEDEEPTGLIPNNYVEDVSRRPTPLHCYTIALVFGHFQPAMRWTQPLLTSTITGTTITSCQSALRL